MNLHPQIQIPNAFPAPKGIILLQILVTSL